MARASEIHIKRAKRLENTLLGGNYWIEKHMSEGAFGLIYRARALQTGENVVIKMLHGHLAEEMIGRFAREAEAVRRVTVPQVVRLLDQGRTPKGRPWLVMELVEGRTMREVLHDLKRFTPFQALRVTEQLLLGLAETHRQDIVHRDLKPENIILNGPENDPTAVVKILDFGLAKILRGPVGTTTLTGLHIRVGSMNYMPPEQIKGEPLDGRADLYAVGLLLFEMLSGVKAYEGLDTEAIMLHLTQQPLSPAQQRLKQMRLPAPLNDFLYKSTELDADSRYAHAEEMLTALRSVRAQLEGQVGAPPLLPAPLAPPPAEVAADPPKPRAAWIALLVLLLLAAAGGVALALLV